MNTNIKYWSLKGHKLFGSLSNSQINELCIIKRFQKAKKGEVMYFTEDGVQRVYILTKGMIKIMSLDLNGEEVIRDVVHEGDLFGELHLDVGEGDDTEYAQALSSDVSVCTFKLSDFESILVKNPALALSYTKFVGLKLKRLQNKYSNLLLKDVRARLTVFLKEWAFREGCYKEGCYRLRNYLTQEDMAKIICSSRQAVTETMNKLQSEGLLDYNRKTISINDINALR
ncbi:MAG TPA: Crp/Fnr family transcriptional regulator [Cytophagales bacterium]|nr:Crp/Fnr family transcriptional regulator [Cytophagales bacterium]